MVAQFDAIIIGTGQAGPPLAPRLAAAGIIHPTVAELIPTLLAGLRPFS